MFRKFIPVDERARNWEKDPKFQAAYDARDNEFAFASALIKARVAADMTQEQVAQAMGTAQPAIARLESGHSLPSMRTLQRYAKATGAQLVISLKPMKQTARLPDRKLDVASDPHEGRAS